MKLRIVTLHTVLPQMEEKDLWYDTDPLGSGKEGMEQLPNNLKQFI
jgi:hypothetical protein